MSYNKTKTDPELGKKIHEHLVKCGVETPRHPDTGIITVLSDGSQYEIEKLDRKTQIEVIEVKFADIMKMLKLDLSDDSLHETPKRFAKMVVNETMWGLDFDAFPKCTTVENKMHYDEMVMERGISVKSACEHHWMPIVGKAYVAYIPNNKVLGLSKMPRIVEYFCRRPQIQERLTEQIYHALQYVLETDSIAVSIVGEHMCVSQRGVEDNSADTVTTKLGGSFRIDPAARAEFLSQIPHR